MTLSEQIERFIKDTNIAHLIIHGDSSTVVTTEGGPVRSFAKVIADADLYLISGTSSILNQVQQLIPTGNQLQEIIDSVQASVDQVEQDRVEVVELYDAFTSIYLGNLASDPTGVTAGTFYYNTTLKVIRQFDGSVWTTPSSSSFHTGQTAPSLPKEGDRWLDTVTGTLYNFWVTSGDGQWVEEFPSAVSNTVLPTWLEVINWAEGDANYIAVLGDELVPSPAKLILDQQAAIQAQAPSLSQLNTTTGASLIGLQLSAPNTTAQRLNTRLFNMGAVFEDFGAVGNGTTDDTNALRNAIAFSQTTGWTVYGTAGKNYKITGTLQLVHQTTGAVAKIHGRGRNTTKITPVGTFDAIRAWGLGFSGAGAGAAQSVEFGGFELSCAGLTGNIFDFRRIGLWSKFFDLRGHSANGIGIYQQSLYDHLYRDIEIRGCSGVGIKTYETQASDPEGFQECSFLRFDNVHVLSCNGRNTQWEVHGGDGYTFTACKPSEGKVGIHFVHGCYGMTLLGTYVDGQRDVAYDNVGILVSSGSFCINVSGGRFWNVRYAVDFAGGGRSTVHGTNVVYNSPIGPNVADVRLQVGVEQPVSVSAGLAVEDNVGLAYTPGREIVGVYTPAFGADSGTSNFTYTKQVGKWVATSKTLTVKYDIRWSGKPPDWTGVGILLPFNINTGPDHQFVRSRPRLCSVAGFTTLGHFADNANTGKLYLYPDGLSASAAYTADANFPANGAMIGEFTIFL